MADDLESATAEYRAAKKAVDDDKIRARVNQERLRDARAVLAEHVLAEARAGTRMRDLVAKTGLSREWIRTILRQAGFHPDD